MGHMSTAMSSWAIPALLTVALALSFILSSLLHSVVQVVVYAIRAALVVTVAALMLAPDTVDGVNDVDTAIAFVNRTIAILVARVRPADA